MIYTIQNTILEIHNFISSLNFGIYFLVSVAAIIFSCYMLYSIFAHRNFGEKTKLKKVIFIPALLISMVFILDMVLAGDIYPNLSAEKMARLFAEDLCAGRTEEISKDKNKILAPNYHDAFTLEWTQKSKEFADILCQADDFIMLEYHYKYQNISNTENCTVVLRTSKILNISKNVDEIEQCDFDFEIRLTKVAIPSRFLGKYMRWRISAFSYTTSKPYTMKEWLDSIKKEIRTGH